MHQPLTPLRKGGSANSFEAKSPFEDQPAFGTRAHITTEPQHDEEQVPSLETIRVRWAAAITVGADDKTRERVYRELRLPPKFVAPVSKCLLRSQNTRAIVRKGLIIELVFPINPSEALDGRELNGLCANSVLEMISPNRDIQRAFAIPKPARGEPVFSRGSLSLGLGSILAVKDKPFTLPNTRNLDILIFEAVKGHAGKDSELIIRIPCHLLFRFDSTGAYTFTWRSGEVTSNSLVLEVER